MENPNSPPTGNVSDLMNRNQSIPLRVRDPPGQSCTYIRPGDHRLEFYRLSTYEKFPNSVPVKPSDLAAAGFYWTGYKDRIICFSCGMHVENWKLGDNGMDDRWHKSDCKMMAGHEILNVPIQEPNFLSQLRLYRADPHPERINFAAIVDPRHKITLIHADLRNEEERRKTFAKWPSHPAPHLVSDLAKEGFFYLGNSDRVQCFSCSGVLRNWASSDNVSQLHRTHFSHCKICSGKPSGNNPMSTAKRIEMDRQHRAKMEQLTADQGESPGPSIKDQRDPAERYLRREAGDLEISSATHSSTFFNHWPRQRIQPSVEQIVRAGFFYLGESDKTKCFYWNGGLQNWDINDEPWTEHAKWFSSRVPRTSRNHVQRPGPSNHDSINRRPESRGKCNGKRTRQEKRGTTESDALPIVDRDTPEVESEHDLIYVFLPDTAIEKYRLTSFSRYPGNFVTSMRLAARHGFYFTGRGDVAQCYCCCAIWNISQGAFTTNLHHSNCQMRNPQFALGNVPMDGLGQFQDALEQSRAISQLSASPGETSEQRAGPSPSKRQRGNESGQFFG